MSRSPSRLLGSLNQRDPKEREIPPMSGIQRAELIPTVILPSRCSVKLVGMAPEAAVPNLIFASHDVAAIRPWTILPAY